MSVPDICHRIRASCVLGDVSARPQRSADHWVVELRDSNGDWRAIDLFLNSSCSSDYPELGVAESTLLSLEVGPTSEAILKAAADGGAAWFRRHEGLEWEALGGTTA